MSETPPLTLSKQTVPMRLAERIAIAGRVPAEADDDGSPRVLARTSVERSH